MISIEYPARNSDALPVWMADYGEFGDVGQSDSDPNCLYDYYRLARAQEGWRIAVQLQPRLRAYLYVIFPTLRYRLSDLVDDCLVHFVAKAFNRFNERQDPWPYLKQCSRRLVLSQIRRRNIEDRWVDSKKNEVPEFNEDDGVISWVTNHDLENLLRETNPLDRKILLLRHGHELSWIETALAVRRPVDTVKKRGQKALNRAQKLAAVERRDVATSDGLCCQGP